MGTVCIPMTLWLTTVLSVPVEDLNNSTRGEDEIDEEVNNFKLYGRFKIYINTVESNI